MLVTQDTPAQKRWAQDARNLVLAKAISPLLKLLDSEHSFDRVTRLFGVVLFLLDVGYHRDQTIAFECIASTTVKTRCRAMSELSQERTRVQHHRQLLQPTADFPVY